MNIFARFKRDRQEAKERELTRQANQRIGVRDFEGHLYIAYDGTPLVPVKDEWTPKEIVAQLDILRGNYVKGRRYEIASRGAAVF